MRKKKRGAIPALPVSPPYNTFICFQICWSRRLFPMDCRKTGGCGRRDSPSAWTSSYVRWSVGSCRWNSFFLAFYGLLYSDLVHSINFRIRGHSPQGENCLLWSGARRLGIAVRDPAIGGRSGFSFGRLGVDSFREFRQLFVRLFFFLQCLLE